MVIVSALVARPAERFEYAARDVFGVVPDQPGGKPQREVAGEAEVDVALHVVPALERVIGVLGAVDLDDDLVLVPHHVGPAPAAPGVPAGDLAAWLGKPEGADDLPGEVEFGQRLRAAGYVTDGFDDQLATVEQIDAGGHPPEGVRP